MVTKEQVKKEIDRLSNSNLEQAYHYLATLNKPSVSKPVISSFKLGGKLDKVDVRTIAYE